MSRFPNLDQFDRLALDTETDGLIYSTNKAFGFSLSTPDGKDYYFDIRRDPMAIRWINDSMEKYKGKVICHNASFDHRMSKAAKINIPLRLLDDTVQRACLIDEHLMEYSLDGLGKKYLGMSKDNSLYEKMAEIFGGLATRNVQMKRIAEAPVEIVAPYAKRDTRLTLDLYDWQAKEIDRQSIHDIIDFERRLMPTIIRAETRGIRVDLAYAEEAADKITPLIDEMQARINALAGWEFNTNSPAQTKKYFEPKYRNGEYFVGNTMIGTTTTGNASLGADYLREIKDPMAQMILEIRSLIKTRDTFLRGHVLAHSVNGRVYPNVNQNKGEDGGTGTGRLSYSGPAMQQIPSRNKRVAAIVKPAFLPDDGQVWVDIDEASFEVRVFAHLVNNPTIVEAYRQNPKLDFHQFVADLTNLPRNATYSGEANAKQLNLSMIFNSGNGAIADKMGMPWEWNSFLPRGKEDIPENIITYKKAGQEALNVIAKYHHRVPGVQELAKGCKAVAEKRGYIFTRLGRRLRFPNGYKSYKASGLLIQATSADINKENWMIIEETLEDRGHLVLNTHDSYSMSLPEDWYGAYKDVKEELEQDKLRVPLMVDLNGVGKNWWAALQGVSESELLKLEKKHKNLRR